MFEIFKARQLKAIKGGGDDGQGTAINQDGTGSGGQTTGGRPSWEDELANRINNA